MTIYAWSYTDADDNANADAECPWQEGMAAKNVNNDARGTMLRVAQMLRDIGGAIAAGGTANGLTVTAASPFTTLADGRLLAFRATADNTGAATLNVNGIGSKAIRRMSDTGDVAIPANTLRSGGIYTVQYSEAANGSAGAWILVNPTADALFSPRVGSTSIATVGTITTGTWQAGLVHALITGATPIIANRGGASTTNVSVEARPGTGGSVFFGLGVTGTFAVKDDANLASSPWFTTNASGTYSSGNYLTSGQFYGDRIGAGDLAPFQYLGNFAGGGTATVLAVNRGFPAASSVGSITCTTTATAYNTSSDYRLKSDVEDFTDSGSMIDDLRPVTFIWNVDGSHDVGFIAHEVQQVYDRAVSGEKDGEEMQGGDWSKLVPILVAELKDVRRRLAELESA